MRASGFKNNLRFALRKEASGVRESLPLNQIEKIGDKLCWFVYDFKDFCLETFFDPRFLTVCFTIVAMVLAALLFYPSDTWTVLSNTFQWIFEQIHWGYVRFCLWMICEISIFGIGMRALGRFTNQQLMKHYHERDTVA